MLRLMSRRVLQHSSAAAVVRTSMVARHVSSKPVETETEQSTVLFESNLATRTYVLNRPKKMNAIDTEMINLIRSKVQEWDSANLCEVIVGTGKGRAFCAGGDILFVMQSSKEESTRPSAITFFKDEFEMNHLLGNLSKPYVAIMDGITMGGGVGLSVHAPFRVATENTVFAMPETKIGYFPDVGANHFLPRLDGELGTYFSLTGTTLRGRAVFELGIATHYIPASRIPDLRATLASLEKATPELVDATIDKFHFDRNGDEPSTPLTGEIRKALDAAFSGNKVEEIVARLAKFAENKEDEVGKWATATLDELHLRSPTSLKVALQAVRRGKKMTLAEVLQMEMGVATAFVNLASADFVTGVSAVLVDKIKERPNWNPGTLAEVDDKVVSEYFEQGSPFLANSPTLQFLSAKNIQQTSYALPSEEEIGKMVVGAHPTSGDMSLTLDELVSRFERLAKGKHGVKEKVLEVVSRRCRTGKNDSNKGYLEWIH